MIVGKFQKNISDLMKIKNIAIIAHVDHGKTTLVDKILDFCSSLDEKEKTERVMDSNDIERERGITILSKNTAVLYKDYKINIVDTPGHSDFGGEVERVLKMVDGALLLVDALEGVMPQTRFVLKKAMELKLDIILVINKIDRPHIDQDQINRVIDGVLELFIELGAEDDQLDFPVIYASAKEGYAIKNLDDNKKDISPVLDMVLEKIPDARKNLKGPFKFQVTTLDYNDYIGRICIGKVHSGSIRRGSEVLLITKNSGMAPSGIDEKLSDSVKIVKYRITKLFTFLGLKRIETEVAENGDVIAIAGIDEMTIGDTLSDLNDTEALERIAIDPPTVSVTLLVNDSPFAGKDGKYVTSRNIRDRLEKELKTNISLEMEDHGDSFTVKGRGELQLAILMENMRRENYEFGVSKPKVITRQIRGKTHEPYEELTMDLPESYSGTVIQELNQRKGILVSMDPLSDTFVRIRYEIPTRGFIGFRNFFLTETRGEGSLSGIFLDYRPYAGDIGERKRGALISMENGLANTYGLFNIQERGDLFITPQTPVYIGMIVGLHSKNTDLDVNPIKEKKLTNVRASGSDEALRLTPPVRLSIETAMDLIQSDEIIEITPKNLRLRKKILLPADRKRARYAQN